MTEPWTSVEDVAQHFWPSRRPLEAGAKTTPKPMSIPLLRSEREASESRLRIAIKKVVLS